MAELHKESEAEALRVGTEQVTSHDTSQTVPASGRVLDYPKKSGSSCRIRAENNEPKASWSKPRDYVRLPIRGEAL